jgi:Fe-S oxidoreductase
MLSTLKFKRIVTQCPHCFNTLKNEYPQMGGEFEVLHYTEYLSEMMGQELLIPSNGNSTPAALTYQDSCYLGRYNQIYKKPRQLLDQAGYQLVEMSDSGENSFCCGGGGGQMWMETDADQRINHKRMEDALATHTETVATACPYCLLMFDDAIRSKGISEELQVLDIAELLDQQYQPAEEA